MDSKGAGGIRLDGGGAAGVCSRLLRLALVFVLLLAAPRSGAAQVQDSVPRAPTVAEAEAMEARLQAAIRVNPAVPSLHAALGDLLRSQARLLEARQAYTEAVRLAPSDPAYRLALGRAHLALDEFEDAEVNFGWGAEISPEDPAMYAGLGEALLGRQRPAEAAAAFERALDLDPGNAETLALLQTAQRATQAAGVDAPQPIPFAAAATRAWTILFAILLTIAGLGLLLPVAAALFVLVFYLPLAILARRKS